MDSKQNTALPTAATKTNKLQKQPINKLNLTTTKKNHINQKIPSRDYPKNSMPLNKRSEITSKDYEKSQKKDTRFKKIHSSILDSKNNARL